jgi:hypothetical protein
MKQESRKTILEALLDGKSQQEAADLAGMSRSTVQRLMKAPDFQAALQDGRNELYRQSVDFCLAIQREVCELLLKAAHKGNVRAMVALRDETKTHMWSEVEQRLNALLKDQEANATDTQ